MKALSVKQPWAWAIAHAGKNIENRGRRTSHRGPVAIHASKTYNDWAWSSPPMVRLFTDPAMRYPDIESLPLGAIVAVAEVSDVHQCPDPEAPCCQPWGEPWYGVGGAAWHYVLTSIRPLAEPIPCRGSLGFWTVPDHIATQLET